MELLWLKLILAALRIPDNNSWNTGIRADSGLNAAVAAGVASILHEPGS